MVGFIKGFFGSKPKAEQGEETEVKDVTEVKEVKVTKAAKPQTASEAFFLDTDDAKTLGNIDYMRSTKVIKRSFPKTKSGAGGFELIQQVSAMEMATVQEEVSATPTSNTAGKPMESQSTGMVQPSEEVSERRRTDTSMDMFRSMARDMKKR